jgi:hypothetical protein
MSYLLLIVFPILSLAGPRGIASFEEKVTSQSYKNCIHSLANAPTTPTYPKTYFQNLEDEESFTLRCHQADTKELMRFVFVTDTEYRSLALPMYYYKHVYRDGSTDSTELPRNVIHFKYQKRDFYLEMGFVDSADIRLPSELPEVAKRAMTTTTKIQNEYVKKYESWLKTQGLEEAIQLKPTTEDELAYLQSCLDKKIADITGIYLQNKFGKIIPAYGVIVNDSNSYRTLPQTEKEKYRRPFAEIEAEVIEDMARHHPACEAVVSESVVKGSFDNKFGKNRDPYETLRRVFFGN